MLDDGDLPGFAKTCLAPAKINLALHVVGQRDDGHHLLETLVTFADAGDRIGLSLASEDRFTVSGPFSAGVPMTGAGKGGNLVLRARDLLREHARISGTSVSPVHLHLEKNLPVTSGIGGGSADSAATLRGLIALWRLSIDPNDLQDIALALGADVPMCLENRPLLARGIGEHIRLLADFPSFPMLIVNPLKAVSTPVIFRTLQQKTNPPLKMPVGRLSAPGWIDAIATMRNDLEPPARSLEADIAAVSDAMRQAGARFVRMSGSGASCFGLFDTIGSRDAAAERLAQRHSGWYRLACMSVAGIGVDNDEHR